MNQEKYILVNLEDEKAKELANIIGNATSRKILEYLSGKDEASESEISKELNLPLSTIHYNLKQLKRNNLVETKHFIYSKKGKRIELYRVVKKFIVIAPKYTRRNVINNIIPLFLISAAISLLIQFFGSKIQLQETVQKSAALYQVTSPQVAQVMTNYYGLWFFIGSWSILIIYIIVNLIKRK